jgi:hypothetical protein
MTDGVIFAIGGVLFIGTTWATVAFLLTRFNELHRRDVLSSPVVDRIESDGLVERHVSSSDSDSEIASSESADQVGGGPA